MHRNFNDFKNETMTALEFIKKNYPKYNEDFVHTDIEINGCRLEELLEEYHQAKLKLLSIPDVNQKRELLRFVEVIKDIADMEFYHWTNEQILEYCIKKLN